MPGLISIQAVRTNPRRVRGQVVRNESTDEVWVNPEDVLRVTPVELPEAVAQVTVRDGTALLTQETVASLAARVNAALGLLSGGSGSSSDGVAQAIAAVSSKVDAVLGSAALQPGFASQLATDFAANVPALDVGSLRAGIRDDINIELISSRTAMEAAFASNLSNSLSGLRTNLATDMNLDSRLSGLRTNLATDMNLDSRLSNLRTNLGADMNLDSRFSGISTSIGGVSSAISDLGGSVSGISTSVSGLGTSIGTLQTSVGSIGTSVSTISTNLSTTLTNTSQLKSGLGSINSLVNSLGTTQTSFFNSVNSSGNYSFTTISSNNLFAP